MSTIMAVVTSEGERRCDSVCHFAYEKECRCICEGRYHGKGRAARELLEEDLRSGALGPELQRAAEAFAPASLFDDVDGQEPASPEQWARARRIVGTRGTILRRLGVARARDVTKRQMAELLTGDREPAS